MPRQTQGSSCVPFLLTVTQIGTRKGGDLHALAADLSGKKLGEAYANWNHDTDEQWTTLDVYSTDTDAPGCGIGTRLYEALAAEACTRQVNLRSDTQLSRYSKGFWQKQVRKGRAEYDDVAGRYVLNQCVLSLEGKKPTTKRKRR